mmetsp:Transcript_6971/g.7971  ORF Transcript_6971/g.7971 Transcript_6971/m.7971 type:complete len:199 (-) Transcript_6971:55-651(-)
MLASRYVIPHQMKKALAKSEVKVAARDVVASQNLVLALKLLPILYFVYVLLLHQIVLLNWNALENHWLGSVFVRNSSWVSPLLLLVGPVYLFHFCPVLYEKLFRRWRLMPKYIYCIQTVFTSEHKSAAELLREERRKLVIRVQNLVEDLLKKTPELGTRRVISRNKLLKQRSASTKRLAKGDLASNIPVNTAKIKKTN